MSREIFIDTDAYRDHREKEALIAPNRNTNRDSPKSFRNLFIT